MREIERREREFPSPRPFALLYFYFYDFFANFLPPSFFCYFEMNFRRERERERKEERKERVRLLDRYIQFRNLLSNINNIGYEGEKRKFREREESERERERGKPGNRKMREKEKGIFSIIHSLFLFLSLSRFSFLVMSSRVADRSRKRVGNNIERISVQK